MSNYPVENDTIKLMIVDDHNLVSEAIRSMLEPYLQIEITSFARNAEEAFTFAKAKMPDMVLMDISLPSQSGIDVTRELKKLYPEVKVIMLSMHESGAYIAKAIQAGASGYLLKNIEKEELYTAVNRVMEGDTYFSKDISRDLINEALSNNNARNPEITITRREKEILILIIQGLTNKEIGEKLEISKRTVDVHREHIMKKCNAKNSVELMHIVNELNLLI